MADGEELMKMKCTNQNYLETADSIQFYQLELNVDLFASCYAKSPKVSIKYLRSTRKALMRNERNIYTRKHRVVSLDNGNMRTSCRILFVLVCHCFVRGSYSICYEHIGCFESKKPYDNALHLLPQPPSEIDVKFKLFTPQNPNRYEILTADSMAIHLSGYTRTADTKFIIHGYQHNLSALWDIKMKDEILKREYANVIFVDWIKGASQTNYAQAAANTRLVGTILAIFMKILYRVAIGGHYNQRMHLIGHGLGAHVAGYAGERISMLGRITGLDPAGPLFEGRDPLVRLDHTDALFVDVIHTDGTGFGMLSPVGHVDFYPNMGRNQPGCNESKPDLLSKLIKGKMKVQHMSEVDDQEIKEDIYCRHLRALSLFTESINSKCRFFSFPNENDVECETRCSVMGYDAHKRDPKGIRFLHTESSEPFCIPQKTKGLQVRGLQKLRE